MFNSQLLDSKINLMAGAETLQIIRYETSYERGESEKVAVEEFHITGNVQPVTGEEMLQLDPGDRKRQHLFIYTRDDLLVDDAVVRCSDGKEYECQDVEFWGPFRLGRVALKDVRRPE